MEHPGKKESSYVVPRETVRTSGYNQALCWVLGAQRWTRYAFCFQRGMPQGKQVWFDRGHPANWSGMHICFSRRLDPMICFDSDLAQLPKMAPQLYSEQMTCFCFWI